MVENDIKNNIENAEVPELINYTGLVPNKLQRLDKLKARCNSCHRLRVIKNKELNLCSICESSRKYWVGGNYEQVKKDIYNARVENPIKDIGNNDNDIENENAVEKVSFYCDTCNTKVIYGQKQCHKCNTLLNWLGTDLEKDDNYLICGKCGIILNKSATNCFNCGE